MQRARINIGLLTTKFSFSSEESVCGKTVGKGVLEGPGNRTNLSCTFCTLNRV